MQDSPRRLVAVLTVLALTVVGSVAPVAAQAPDAEQLKHEAFEQVASMAKLSQVMVDSVFSFSELGFQERRSTSPTSSARRGSRSRWTVPECRPATSPPGARDIP